MKLAVKQDISTLNNEAFTGEIDTMQINSADGVNYGTTSPSGTIPWIEKCHGTNGNYLSSENWRKRGDLDAPAGFCTGTIQDNVLQFLK